MASGLNEDFNCRRLINGDLFGIRQSLRVQRDLPVLHNVSVGVSDAIASETYGGIADGI